MTTNRTSRRAEDFDRALTAERGAAMDPTMATLVAVAGALTALPQRPAPAFRDALRTRLMAEAASMLPAASVPAATGGGSAARTLQNVLSKPAMQVATGGLAAVVAVAGVGVGASRSLPGDALYGLKRTVEGWQVGLAGGQAAEASALLEHAQTRIDEIRDLLRNGALSQVADQVDALNKELKSAVDRLLAESRAGSRSAYDRLQAVLASYSDQLLALYQNVPADARDDVAAALQTLNVTGAKLATVPVPPVPTPKPKPTPSPTSTTSTTPSAPTPTSTSIVPSTPPPTTPSSILPSSILPSTPTITPPATILPTLPVTLPPLAP